MNTDRHWVVVQFRSGTIKLWRDYDDGGMTWGSPAYAVLGYITGGYTAARRYEFRREGSSARPFPRTLSNPGGTP